MQARIQLNNPKKKAVRGGPPPFAIHGITAEIPNKNFAYTKGRGSLVETIIKKKEGLTGRNRNACGRALREHVGQHVREYVGRH